MAVAAAKESGERKKMIMAIGLGALAILALWWTFIGFGSSPKPQKPAPNRPVATTSPQPGRRADQPQPGEPQDFSYLQVIGNFTQPSSVPDPRRNIFAYYEKPTPPPVQVVVPSPSPTPPPPLTLSAVSPATVYARTDDFTLEATGDKFIPGVQINVDGRDLPTRFVSAQQLSAVVPAAMIANAGQRTVSVTGNNGILYSEKLSLNVSAPPTPNFSYIGILGRQHNVGDTAYVVEKSSKEIQSVQRGDVIGGRFRVISIAVKELIVVDVNLKIKHPIQMTDQGDKGGSFPQGRPTPRVAAEDDEP